MRILFLASYFPRPSKPQIGTWALEQAKALSRIADVQVICCTSYLPGVLSVLPKARPWVQVPESHRWDNVSVRYLKALHYPIKPFKKWAYSKPELQMNIAWKSVKHRLLAEVEQFNPQLIYAHHTAVNGYFAERLHRITNLPYVVTDHDFSEITDCEKFPARHEVFDRIMRSASKNVCVCNRMEDDMKRIFPAARAVAVHNGINSHPKEIFSTPRPAELADKQVIFSAGMFAPRKGFPLLVEAFAKIANTHPNAVLRIAGDGEQRPEIEAAIAKHQLQNRVQLLGLMPQKKVFQEMAWSDLFALIGWDEPFATVFSEAMGTGKPIITASDGGINDVVENGVHGMIVPPKDVDAAAKALDYLLANPEARREMGRNAMALVNDHLTWDANSREMLRIFEKAARTTAPVRRSPTRLVPQGVPAQGVPVAVTA